MTEIQTEHVTEQALIVHPRGELDVASVPALRDAIDAALGRAASVILDLSDVGFIDSSIVSVIVVASADVARRKHGNQFVVASPPGSHPRRVLDLVDADQFIRLRRSRRSPRLDRLVDSRRLCTKWARRLAWWARPAGRDQQGVPTRTYPLVGAHPHQPRLGD